MKVLKNDVQIADTIAYPAGGPLLTLPKGTALTRIREDVLSQLHVDHFVDDPDNDDPHPELVDGRYAALSTAGPTDGLLGNRDGDLPPEAQE